MGYVNIPYINRKKKGHNDTTTEKLFYNLLCKKA